MGDDIYAKLEEKFPRYEELAGVAMRDNGERMVALSGSALAYTTGEGILDPSTGDDIFVREGVLRALEKADSAVRSLLPGTRLVVVYGYRSPAIQKAGFGKLKLEMGFGADDDSPAMKNAVHKFIAVPEVAGHPTGGAVDVVLQGPDGRYLDMGTGVHALVKESFVFSPFISREAWRNRQILRQCMLQGGFAPFDGEWWHFSYGDREWAFYYRKPGALYDQIDMAAADTRPAAARRA